MNHSASENPGQMVAIELGGKTRNLKYSFRAMVAFQQATGRNLLDKEVLEGIFKKISPEDILGLTWAMLLHEEPELPIADVLEWITLENQLELQVKLYEAWLAGLPKLKEDEKDKVPLPGKPPAG